jgi:methionine aminopeptidase
VSEIVQKVCEEFKCSPVENVYSHKLKKHLIDGNDVIANKDVPERKIEKVEFMPGDVFSL